MLLNPKPYCRRFPWDTQQLLIQLKYLHDNQDLNTTSTLLPSKLPSMFDGPPCCCSAR
jgi:hypothetical protein